ncbi:MAG TPA: VCBS repeat-containing protein, partial [Roseivirga sp.]
MKLVQKCLFISAVLLFGCKEEIELSNEKLITEFKFLKSINDQLDQDYTGIISGTEITVDFPHGFSASGLKASFKTSDNSTATIGSVPQVSGVTINDFSNSVTYTITAEDNTTSAYTVSMSRIGVEPNNDINQTTSYHYELNTSSWINYNTELPSALNFYHGGFLSRAIYDFDKDGDNDLMMGNLNFDDTGLLNSPRPVNYIQNNNGYSDQTSSVFSGNVPGQVHPRKAILGDFDKNGWMDVVFAGHGFDQPPFPGEQALIMLNNNGTFSSSYLTPGGFYHSVCSGDIDNDGDLDLFFTENYASQSKFLMNNGNGEFSYDPSIFPSDISNLNYFTSELYDLNNDGYLDLVIAGHTHENATPRVLWGNYTGKYSSSRSSIIPSVNDWEIIIDINFLDI